MASHSHLFNTLGYRVCAMPQLLSKNVLRVRPLIHAKCLSSSGLFNCRKDVFFYGTKSLRSSVCSQSLMIDQRRHIIIGSLGARVGGGDFVDEVEVIYKDELPCLLVPMPSRRERCQFTLKPLSHRVGDFLRFLREEDGGVERAMVFSTDGYRVAQATTIDTLMKHNFKLEINDKVYSVEPPPRSSVISEDATDLDDVKSLLCNLYNTLHLEEHQLQREQQLIARAEQIKLELQPLEQAKWVIEVRSAQKYRYLAWTGLTYMGLQIGLLARLTWWEYSWDVMEPVTYFVTYGTSICIFGYFLLARIEYLYPEARDRQFLKLFYKGSRKQQFSVKAYNKLRNELTYCQREIARLRDPLKMQMPIQQLN